MELNVKGPGCGAKKAFKLEGVENSITVGELKKLAEAECGLAAEQQRFFLKGKQLRDEDTLEKSAVGDKATLFLSKGAGAGPGGTVAAAAAVKPEEKKDEEPMVSSPCLGGCGFFATAKTENYCSKCYSKKEAKEKVNTEKADKEKQDAEKAKVEEEKKAAGGDAPEEEKVCRPVQTDKTRCWVKGCEKKVGLMGFDCRCGYVFCAKHRYAETHDCDYDHQQRGRDILAKTMGGLGKEASGS